MNTLSPDPTLTPEERALYLEDHVQELIADKEKQSVRIWKLEQNMKTLQGENRQLRGRVDTLEQDNHRLTGRMDTLEQSLEEARGMIGTVSSMGQALKDIVRDALKFDDLASLRQLERRLLKLRLPECASMIEEIEKREGELMQAQGTPRTESRTTNVFHPGANQITQSTLQSPSFGMPGPVETHGRASLSK